MSDVWASVSELDAATQNRLADMLEARGADTQQQAMRRAFLELIDFPADAHVLEVGCGDRCSDPAARPVAGGRVGHRR